VWGSDEKANNVRACSVSVDEYVTRCAEALPSCGDAEAKRFGQHHLPEFTASPIPHAAWRILQHEPPIRPRPRSAATAEGRLRAGPRMAADDSDVSEIILSDEDKAPVQRGQRAAVGAAAGASAAERVKAPAKHRRRVKGKGLVAFTLPSDAEDISEDDGAVEEAAEEGDGKGRVEDESKPLGWSYFKHREPGDGPVSWDEVDADELHFVAESLARSTSRAANPTDIDEYFHAPVEEDYFVPDPLGRGVIDPSTLVMVRPADLAPARLRSAAQGKEPVPLMRILRSTLA
jgi:hypothetical protein